MHTQERIKQRREYLKKKGAAYTKVGIAGSLAVPCALYAFVFAIGAGVLLLMPDPQAKAGGVFALLVALALGGASFLLARVAGRVLQKAKQIPFVPPVTANILLPEEVLVRGSEEPAQEQSKVLLRGTDGSTDSGEQELLRSSQGQERE